MFPERGEEIACDHIAMKFKGAPNPTSINPLERLASWSYTMVEEIISLRSNEIVNHQELVIYLF